MGCRVVPANCSPPLRVDLSPGRLACSYEAFSHRTPVNVDVRSWLEGIVDVDQPGLRANRAGIANLPARLPIERGAVEDHLNRIACLGFVNRTIRADHSEHSCVGRGLLVSQKFGWSLGK